MKKYLSILMILCGLLIASNTSWALTIQGGTDVGGVDTLITAADLGNAGYGDVNSWASGVLGFSITFEDVTGSGGESGNWKTTYNGAVIALNTYTFDLPESSAYYIVKTGKASWNGAGADHFLFQNLDALSWAVINLQAQGINIQNIGKISHLRAGGNTQVPEPATLILLGLGLMGIAGIRRKK